MNVQTILAFDVGDARIGVAVGNSFLREATPLAILAAAPRDALFKSIEALMKIWQADRLVVGVARHASGEASPMTARCERLANQLSARFNVPVDRVDERYSSIEAEGLQRVARKANLSRPRESLDDLAAAVILKRYFDESDANAA